MSEILEQQPTIDPSQGPADGGEQSDVSLRRYRNEREGDRPPLEDRKPYAHADQPFESEAEKWQPSEPAPRGGFQRRIDRLTKEKAELERRLAERQGTTGQGQQFESIEQLTERVIREARDRERASAQQAPQSQSTPETTSQQQAPQQFPEKYLGELRRVKAANPDYDAVFTPDVMFPNYIHEQLTRMEKGAEVAYALAKNKAVLKKILDLNEEALRRGDNNFSEAYWEFGSFVRSLQNTSPAAQTAAPMQGDRRQRHVANAETLRQRLAAAASTDHELAAALKNPNAPPVPGIIYPAILDTPNSSDVAIYLTKHPEMQQRITMLFRNSGDAVFQSTRNPAAAQQAAALAVIQEVHRISAALEFGTALPTQQRIERPVSQAPVPITPVGGGGSMAQDDGVGEGSDIDLSRYRGIRNRQRNPRRG